MPRKNCRCGSEDHQIAIHPKPHKKNEKRRKQVHFNEDFNRSCNKGKNNNNQKIYAFTACVSRNEKCPSGNFGDTLQLTNWILDSEATCHMTPDISDFIPGS